MSHDPPAPINKGGMFCKKKDVGKEDTCCLGGKKEDMPWVQHASHAMSWWEEEY